jgi:hypothetical protein
MTYKEHWKRGANILLSIGVATIVVTLAMAVIGGGIFYLVGEVFPGWIGDAGLELISGAAFIFWLPIQVSEILDKKPAFFE